MLTFAEFIGLESAISKANTNVRLPEGLHQTVKQAAAMRCVTIETAYEQALRRWLAVTPQTGVPATQIGEPENSTLGDVAEEHDGIMLIQRRLDGFEVLLKQAIASRGLPRGKKKRRVDAGRKNHLEREIKKIDRDSRRAGITAPASKDDDAGILRIPPRPGKGH